MQENILTLKQTEEKLYNYFKKDKLINSYRDKIDYLNSYIKEIDYKIKHVDIEINADIKAIGFNERVQGSLSSNSYIERIMIEMIDNLMCEKYRVKKEITDLETRIKRLEADNKIIESNITMLKDDFREFVNNKYRYRKSNREIAIEMNMSESSITRLKEQALTVIEKWEESLFYN